MNDTDRVHITTDVARRASVYHTLQHCQTIQNSTLTEISYGTARINGLEKCGNCENLERGGGFADTTARKLAHMEPDELLGGETA